MKRKASQFLAALTVGGLLVWLATMANNHFLAVGSGIAAILAHMVLSWRDGHDEEVADASYFLGFLLTLVLLAAGLWKLAPIGADAGNTTGPQVLNVLPFVHDLAAGFLLTIVGLTARQVRVLAMGAASTATDERMRGEMLTLLAAQKELVASTSQLAQQFDGTAISQTIRQADDALLLTKEALAQLKRTVTTASTAIETAVDRFGNVVGEQSDKLAGAAGALSSSLAAQTDLVGAQVTQILERIVQHRTVIEQALTESIAVAAQTQRELGADLQGQREEWQRELERAHGTLATMHEQLEIQYSRGLRNVGQSADTFANLTAEVLGTIDRIPDPTTRLEALWVGIQRVDDMVAGNARLAATELVTLSERARSAHSAVDDLAKGTRAAAGNIQSGGAATAEALRKELQQIDGVLADFHRVLESRVKSLAVR